MDTERRARLVTLGGLALTRSDSAATGKAVRRRQLALLALLASAGERGLTRDQLLVRLWGDSVEEKARHSLDQAISELRKSLGRDAIVRAGAGLRLNPAVVESDLGEFTAAVRANDADRAVGLYVGPFLDGFHLEESPEFDEWMETERRTLARAYVDALTRLARETLSRGDHADAARWWRKLASEEPLSGQVALELMRALAAAGDRASALAHYREHQARVRRELGSEPDATVEALAAQLRGDVTGPGQGGRTLSANERLLAHLREALKHMVTIDAPIARGGFMLTFAARDRAGRRLVLHVLRPELIALLQPTPLVTSLRALTELRHPHLQTVLDAGHSDGLLWVMTPANEGEVLRSRLARERQLPLRDAITLGVELADALAYAHGCGVLHLDLGPKRILFTSTGALITEIGFARAVRAAVTSEGDTTGVVIGTAVCMSPEIMIGDPTVDGRADSYSLACLLYQALAGTAPAGGTAANAQAAAMQRLTSRVTPIGELRDGLTVDAERAIMSGLSRSPADRPTMPEMFTALRGSA